MTTTKEIEVVHLKGVWLVVHYDACRFMILLASTFRAAPHQSLLWQDHIVSMQTLKCRSSVRIHMY
jgi:hypothetical protein